MTRTEEPAVLIDNTTGSTSPAYGAGDAIGGVSSNPLQWANVGGIGGVAYLNDVVVTLQTATAADLLLILYSDTFTAGTDNAAFAEQAADIQKHLGIISIPASSFVAVGGNVKVATVITTPIILTCAGGLGGVLYGQLIANGALTLADAVVYVKLGIYRG